MCVYVFITGEGEGQNHERETNVELRGAQVTPGGRCNSRAYAPCSVPPIVVARDPLEWTGDREAHTNCVLPSVRKGWTCKACGDTAVWDFFLIVGGLYFLMLRWIY